MHLIYLYCFALGHSIEAFRIQVLAEIKDFCIRSASLPSAFALNAVHDSLQDNNDLYLLLVSFYVRANEKSRDNIFDAFTERPDHIHSAMRKWKEYFKYGDE